MKVLLDTNIIIERESSHQNQKGIGSLFYWLDKLGYTKCLNKITIEEINKHNDKKIRDSFNTKLQSYTILQTEAPMHSQILEISDKIDTTENDKNDNRLLNEVLNKRVDILITEDKKIHKKAELLKIEDKIFKIESFLEKANAENPELLEYKYLIAKKAHIGSLNLNDSFFDSFKRDYKEFEDWFNRKAEDPAYVCLSSDSKMLAFLYLKKEDETEDYYSEGRRIEPSFPKKKRLKIGTFKVTLNGYKLGERFLKIIFDNAIKQRVEEIYVTIFDNDDEKSRLIELLENWGFNYWGTKSSKNGIEKVYVRPFLQNFDNKNPKKTFPYISSKSKIHFIPILPIYHTDLLPDSMLKTESAENFIQNKACRNAISKVYLSHAPYRNIKKGDLLLFYRTKDGGPAKYTSVITTLGIIESVQDNIQNEEELISLCEKRSVFEKEELKKQWKKSSTKPFIINFLYTHSFPKKVNLQSLIDIGIIKDVMSVPKPFEEISAKDFEKIIEKTETDKSIIV